MESDLCSNERQDLLTIVDLKSTYIRVVRDILKGINLDPNYLDDPAERAVYRQLYGIDRLNTSWAVP